MKRILFVGMDVHKNSISVGLAEEGSGEARFYGQIPAKLEAIDVVTRKLASRGNELRFAYEAGPGGFCIQRHLQSKDLHCIVAAPSLIPKKAGDRIKTDRRDAVNLARLFRAGELTAIGIPDEADEAMRDLFRSRSDAKVAQRRSRQQMQAFLLRHGVVYQGTTNWSKMHYRWLHDANMGEPLKQIVLQEYIDAERQAAERVERISQQISLALPDWRRFHEVCAYQAFRGVSWLTAVGVAAEIGDMGRFNNAKYLMAFVGLVPSERSSGDSVRRGGITKTGNTHVRRLLVESAWSYRLQARKTSLLLKRQADAPEVVRELSWKAQLRLCGKYRRLRAKGKSKQHVVTSVARELTGFLWEAGRVVNA